MGRAKIVKGSQYELDRASIESMAEIKPTHHEEWLIAQPSPHTSLNMVRAALLHKHDKFCVSDTRSHAADKFVILNYKEDQCGVCGAIPPTEIFFLLELLR